MSDQPNTDGPDRLSNPAVALCTRAWKKAFRAGTRNGQLEVYGRQDAAVAFRENMPPLSTVQNCRDFIACVAQGMLLDAIDEKRGGKLLYAAQVAMGILKNAEDSPRPVASAAPCKVVPFRPSPKPRAARSRKP